jgi:hypothetical protein
MAIQVIKFDSSSQFERWAVVHTTSETMYAPVFHEELIAELFAACPGAYNRGIFEFTADLTETAQTRLADQLKVFLDETCPFGNYYGDRRLPDAWALALVPEDEDPEDRADLAANYNGLSLLEDLQSSNHERAASFMLAKFKEWGAGR